MTLLVSDSRLSYFLHSVKSSMYPRAKRLRIQPGTRTHACKPKADIISMQCQEANRMITSHTYYSVYIASKHKKSCTGSIYVTSRPFFCTAISQQLLHGRVAQPCGSNPFFGWALAGGIQWLNGMCSNGLAGIKVDVLKSDDICQPCSSTKPCLAKLFQRRQWKQLRRATKIHHQEQVSMPTTEDLADSEGVCSTSSRCEHKCVTDPSLGLPGVFKDGLHCIHPIEMPRQVLPVPCASSKVVQIPRPVPGAREQASHHLHRYSARPCHRKGYPAVETRF